jgi:hypothetical protein
MSDELRAAKGLLTVSTVDQLVTECLGKVQVLAIVGRCRTGKTWATKDWVASRNDDLEHVAYADCQGIGFGRAGVFAFDGVECDLREKHYPKFLLDGIDVVAVDEPHLNPVFVRELLSRTAPEAGAAAHRLVVLLLQQTVWLDRFELTAEHARCYSTAGLPLEIAKPKENSADDFR